MGLFNKKKEREKFKAKLTYGDDIVSLYEEAKRLEGEVRIWRERIHASEEYARKAELEEQQQEVQKQYEILLGKQHGFDPTHPGTFVHIRDYIEGMNKCKQSPFGYHALVWENSKRENICIFCKQVV